MPRILVAKTTAMIEHEGRRMVIKQGITTAHEGHDVVNEHPELWEPQTVTFETEKSEPVKESKAVETATAAPGEKRTVTTTSAAPTRRGRRTGGTAKEGSGE
jgi:hypothetical protein